jgi:pilus assembly protein Flp/PilA
MPTNLGDFPNDMSCQDMIRSFYRWINSSLKEKTTTMRHFVNLTSKLQILKDTRGQDLIEYALMAGFVAVSAAAVMPGVASSINVIFSKVNSIMIAAAAS